MGARELFLLDPEVCYLNHGAFGACPQPVFDVYQARQRELEREPVDFWRRLGDELAVVRSALAGLVGTSADDLALFPNATYGLNAALRSLELGAGDEILTTGHEYGAIELLLEFVCERTGARVVQAAEIDPDAIWAAKSERTRVLLVSHITSPTARLLPVEELCAAARAEGVLTVIDGAHAPGHVPLDLTRLGADFYSANCHKWLCAPKGSGFLYVRPERQELVDPLVVGWGYHEPVFALRQDWQSTTDPAAYLAVPAAIEFVREHGRADECRRLLREWRRSLADGGVEPLTPEQPLQMASFVLPDSDPVEVERRLRGEFKIEAPVRSWNGQTLIRVSVAPYNEAEDCERLAAALGAVFERRFSPSFGG